ncbi:MAG: DUF2520 domain-containing protein [Actinomycetota bacterium]|nr:DUF2520 domain-containing protein [Actinomycetota bacterium]
MTATIPSRVALVGAGRVGTAVALFLQQSGIDVVGVSSRSPESQRAAARLLSCAEFDYRVTLPSADLVLLGVVDAALEEVADAIAPHIGNGTYVSHFSGSVGTSPLDKTRAFGGRPCALHPVQAFPDVEAGRARLAGSAWGVTCDEDDAEWAEAFVRRALKGNPVRVREEDRPVWHAAAVMASNGISALLAIGESLLRSIEVDEPNAVLDPIAAATIANARHGGGGGATLTGPVVRGESVIIRRHLDRLVETDDDLVTAYANVVAMIVGAARAAGRIDADVADTMTRDVKSR